MSYEEIIMNIIVYGGNARTLAMEAISYAKNGDFPKAEKALTEAGDQLNLAHSIQTRLIQDEAAGNTKNVSLLMVHAQDHLMNAITVKDMAMEFINLYRKMATK